MMIAFKTRDGLIIVDDCPDVDENSDRAMRWLKPYPPIIDGARKTLPEVRCYILTTETFQGCPVFEEKP